VKGVKNSLKPHKKLDSHYQAPLPKEAILYIAGSGKAKSVE
jgi:hypothetical protein